ncbi:MAG: POTRA domain-containing protein [Terriglobales bacterium]
MEIPVKRVLVRLLLRSTYYVLLPSLPLAIAQPMQTASRPAVAVNSNMVTEILFTGSQRFQNAELVSASGLKTGQDGSEENLKRAADRLAATGMFADITYSYVSSSQGTRVEFHVNDNPKLLPAHFDNFVWLSRTELLKRLAEREPLFRGEIPNAGEMYLHLADDLRALLVELGVAFGEVKVFPEVAQGGGGVLGFIYSVEGVKLPIRSIELPGVSADLVPVLQKIAATSLLGQDYSENRLRSAAALDLLPEYHRRGFLRAKFGAPVAELQDRTTGAVAVRLPVTEGNRYQLANIQWSGNTVFSVNELGKALKVRSGEVADQLQLEADLGGISKIYGTRGYLEARLQPKYSFDDSAKTVSVDVDVREGGQYRMGKVSFTGLTEDASAPLYKLWKLHAGDVYDASYPGLFLTTAGRSLNLSGLKVQVSQVIQHDSKLIDLIFRFTPK